MLRPLIRPIVRPPVRRVTAPSFGWSPIVLFAAGEQGAWYDPSDLSSMNTKHDGSGAVPGVGDPVGYIADKSGRGNHAKQTTDTARPTLQADANGRYYLQFDGVDDCLRAAHIDPAAFTVIAGCLPETVATNVMFSNIVSGSNRTVISAESDLVRWFHYDGVSYARSRVPPVGNIIVRGTVDLSNKSGLALAVNGLAPDGVSSGTSNSSPGISIGTGTGGFSPFAGRIYSLIVRGAASTAAQIAAAERYAAAKTGVTLA